MIVPVDIPAAFLIDRELAGYIILARRIKDGTVPMPVQIAMDKGDFGLMASTGSLPAGFLDLITVRNILSGHDMPVSYYPTFFGTIRLLSNKGEPAQKLKLTRPSWPLLLLLPKNRPGYFNRPYENPEEMFGEFLDELAPLMPGLPPQEVIVNLAEKLVTVKGTSVT